MLLRLLPESLKERLRRRAGAVTARARLENLRRAGFTPRKIIDAGAYRGEWTRTARGVFPEAELLMIEPQPQLRPVLEGVCAELPGVRFSSVALGTAQSTVHFRLGESNSGVVQPGSDLAGTCEVPMAPLVDVVREAGFVEVDFLKLDLQGHELQALAGAGELFGRIEVIQTEVSVLRIGEVPLVDEIWARFRESGYRLYDIFGQNYRPLDGALWQCDLIFVRENSPLLVSRQWA